MDEIAHNQSEGSSAPRVGFGRATFGMTRDLGKRLEVTFSLKSGATVTTIDEVEESLTADIVADYAKQLQRDISEGKPRTFLDGWGQSGQSAWVNLGEVVAFSLRPAK